MNHATIYLILGAVMVLGIALSLTTRHAADHTDKPANASRLHGLAQGGQGVFLAAAGVICILLLVDYVLPLVTSS